VCQLHLTNSHTRKRTHNLSFSLPLSLSRVCVSGCVWVDSVCVCQFVCGWIRRPLGARHAPQVCLCTCASLKITPGNSDLMRQNAEMRLGIDVHAHTHTHTHTHKHTHTHTRTHTHTECIYFKPHSREEMLFIGIQMEDQV